MKHKSSIIGLLSACCLFFSSQISAQDVDETRTLIGDNVKIGTENIGFFVAPAIGFTQMDGDNATLFNVRAGISLGDSFAFGGYFNTSIGQINPVSETLANIYMDYWTVGGFAEYTLYADKLIHFSFPLQIGYGEVQMDNETGDAGLGEATFFQIEPSALLEVNVHKNARFNLGAGYRFIGDMQYRNFDQSDLSGFTLYAVLKIGIFK